MLHFDCDYMEGAHPAIMRKLLQTNLEQTPGYGDDTYSRHAKDLVRKACACPEAEVYLLVGGTQTNAFVIDGVLARHQGVLAAESGHINVHEAGAVESRGHKVITLPSRGGKVSAADLSGLLHSFYADDTWPHMVQPGMLYISQPTEFGTLYSLEELTALSAVCRQHKLAFYIDGARLGYALASESNDASLKDIAALSDAFYIGGTKVGALFGEALVITRPGLIPGAFTLVKQHGALLAKGRMLGLQFETLFEDGLYLECGRHAVDMAMRLKRAFTAAGYRQYIDSPTNQQFFILPNGMTEYLKDKVSFELWGPPGEHESTVRFVTSWATKEEDVAALEKIIGRWTA